MGKNSFYTFFLLSLSSLHASPPTPLFSSDFVTNFYWGRNIDVLNTTPFESYSVFQYIYDFGIQLENQAIHNTDQTFSLTALARMKGVFGNRGSGLVPLLETEKFEIWMRELTLKYMPFANKNNFLQAGFLPFQLGNGFTLGNAYSVNIPVQWQYVYKQINQFRPGIQLQIANNSNSFSATGYVGFFSPQNDLSPLSNPSGISLETYINDVARELSAPLIDWGKGQVGAIQLNICPSRKYAIHIKPYACFLHITQFIEVPDDATADLQTGGIALEYKSDSFEWDFEFAQNFGDQYVHALDRNLVFNVQPDLLYNAALFYAPTVNPTVPVSSVPLANFNSSNYRIDPSYAAQYGNGGSFVFPVNSSTSYIFKNAYDRYRTAYVNRYAGNMLYFQFLLKRSPLFWGMGTVYISGDNPPNDSLATLVLTRLTPNVKYKDYDKTYKGFLGINQFAQASGFGGLYFGPGIYRLTNIAAIGTSLAYINSTAHHPTSALAIVSYFKPFAALINVTDQNGIVFSTPLSHYVGTELNTRFLYDLTNHFKLSFITGFFFPGKIYQAMKDQFTAVEDDILTMLTGTTVTVQETRTQKVAYFVNFSVEWLFDSTDIERKIKKWLC